MTMSGPDPTHLRHNALERAVVVQQAVATGPRKDVRARFSEGQRKIYGFHSVHA